MAELAKVTNDAEKLKGFMDTVNRIATITTANTGDLAQSMKFFGPIAGVYGTTPEDMMMAQGIAARFGIQNTMGGTHLKDFLQRLNPYEKPTPKRLNAMMEMGFLENPIIQTAKNGKSKVVGGNSIFFQDGKAKNMLDIFGIFADKYKKIIEADPENGFLKFAGYMQDILGEQGQDIAAIVAQNADNIKKMQADYARVLPVEEGVRNFQQTFTQTFGAFMSNLENIGVDAVVQLMEDITDTLKAIGPYVEAVGKWVNEHQELVTWLLKTALAISAVLITLGLLQVIGGTAIKLLAGGFKFGISPITGMLKAVRALSRGLGDLKAGFDIFRMAGSGRFASLFKGLRLAFPKLDKWVITPVIKLAKFALPKMNQWMLKPAIKLAKFLAGCSKMVVVWAATRLKMLAGWIATQAKMVGTWLASAARIAAGWLIAMGPVGWIILGVTAIIAAAVWAWNNNFMGFRDKCLSVWSAIRDWGSRAWNSISDSVRSAIDLVCSWIDKAKEALGIASKVPANLGHSEVMVNRWLQHDGAGGDDSGSLFKPNAPFIGGGSGGDTISSVTTHNVSINVASTREAADMVIKLPQKYTANNADFNLAT
jgi:TP901 family phage tail tape measure protein